MSESEYGDVLGEVGGGIVISSEGNPAREDGTVVWVSQAFNALTSDELRDVANYMDTLSGDHPEHRWNWKTDADGVQWVCKGYHDRSAGCEWEIGSAKLVR
jgi:hypothetical protein